MRRRNFGRPEPQAIDDCTGFKVNLSDLKKQWDGFLVVDPERRNPQDFVRGVPDKMKLPFARPEAPDQFIALPILSERGFPLLTEDGRVILTEGVVVEL